MKVKEPPNNNNEIKPDELDNRSNMDKNTEYMHLVTSTEVMEPVYNNEKTQDNLDNSSNLDNNTDSMPEITLEKEKEPANISNAKNNSNTDNDINTVLEATSAEAVKPLNYNNNEKTQYNLDNIPNDEIKTIPEVIITKVIEPTNNITEKPIVNSNNHIDIYDMMDMETTIEVTKIEILEPPYDEDALVEDTSMKVAEPSDIIKETNMKNDSKETQGNSDNSSNVILEHMRSLKVVLERTKYYGCSNCNLVFFRPRDVKLHAVKHLLPTRDVKGRSFKNRSKFEDDLFAHTYELRARVKKTVPEIRDTNIVSIELKNEFKESSISGAKSGQKTLPNASEVEKHIRKNDDKTFTCLICLKVFNYAANTRIHVRIHTGERPYVCVVCDKRFTQSGALKLHLIRHSGVKDYKCTYCHREFADQRNLQNHIRIHTGEKPFKCSFCETLFSDPSALKRHERTHTGVKPYVCEICSMRFSDPSGLHAHRRRHSGKKDVKCMLCPKKFYTKDYMKKHMICIHSKERNYQCGVCHKRFALKQYLKSHTDTNCGDRLFKCYHCGYGSAYKGTLKTHMIRIHGNEMF